MSVFAEMLKTATGISRCDTLAEMLFTIKSQHTEEGACEPEKQEINPNQAVV